MKNKRVFQIFYNDGVYYGKMTFTNKTQLEIESAIKEEIYQNNKNLKNNSYLIGRENFREIQYC